jgi:hypothetical protein
MQFFPFVRPLILASQYQSGHTFLSILGVSTINKHSRIVRSNEQSEFGKIKRSDIC